jgi:hypothetical protein
METPMKRRHLFGPLLALTALLAAGTTARADDAQPAAVPDDSIALHYYRPDGNYDNWGVHFWESFEKVQGDKIVAPRDKADMPIGNITWFAPMKPTGKDGFGMVWIVKAGEFRNGKVNYIIHRGDTKDCVKDSTWFLPQGRQVFINSGDCTAYFSAADAEKARGR